MDSPVSHCRQLYFWLATMQSLLTLDARQPQGQKEGMSKVFAVVVVVAGVGVVLGARV
jgi:hypothetical protein